MSKLPEANGHRSVRRCPRTVSMVMPCTPVACRKKRFATDQSRSTRIKSKHLWKALYMFTGSAPWQKREGGVGRGPGAGIQSPDEGKRSEERRVGKDNVGTVSTGVEP